MLGEQLGSMAVDVKGGVQLPAIVWYLVFLLIAAFVASDPGLRSNMAGEHTSFKYARGDPALGVPIIIRFSTCVFERLLCRYTLASNPPLLWATMYILSV